MSLTAQQLAVQATSYIGVFAIGPAATPWKKFTDERSAILARLALDLTGTMQDIVRARSDLYQTRIGAQFYGPVTNPVNLTNGSKAVDLAGSTFPFFLDGATVNIGGVWTESRQAADGTVTLLDPYTGPTGPAVMTAYDDSIVLNSAVYARVLGNVYRNGSIPLAALPNRDALRTFSNGWACDYGARTARMPIAYRHPSPPQAYWVESFVNSAGQLGQRLRLAPLPDQAYTVEFDAEIAAPQITVANLANADGSDPGTQFPLPDRMDESILIDLFMARWCRSPWFKDQEHRTFLLDAAEKAMKKLKEFQVQAQSGASLRSHGYV